MIVRAMRLGQPFRFLHILLSMWFVSRAATWIIGSLHMTSAFVSRAAPSRLMGMTQSLSHPFREEPASSSRPTPDKHRTRPLSSPNPQKPDFAVPDMAHRHAVSPADMAPARQGIFDSPPDGSLAPFPAPVPASVPASTSAMRDRWSLSAWLLHRPHDEARPSQAGQLGASQAGARLAYDLTPSAGHALAIHGRVSGALEAPVQAEGAVGITFRPARAIPVALAVERRFNIDEGGRNAFAAYLSGGLNPTAVPAGMELEGYAQAGIVGASRTDGFADGRIALSRPLPVDGGLTGIAAGLAMSGGVQPSLSRLDIGPQLSVRFPLGHGHARAAVEWRQRVAGNARPPSGPALILASDF